MLTFIVAEITFNLAVVTSSVVKIPSVAVINSSVAKITFVVAETTFEVIVITSSVVKIPFIVI